MAEYFRNTGRVWLVSYAPLIVWITVIFYLSSDSGSMTKTLLFVRPLLEFIFPAATEETFQIYHGYIRKLAHFTEYAVLALFAVRAVVVANIETLAKYRYLLAFALVLIIALADEFGQSFRPSRTGSILDVGIDVVGGASMIVVLWAINRPRPYVV